MVASRLFLCLALLLPAIIARAADNTNTPPPTTNQISPAAVAGSPEWVEKTLKQNNSEAVIKLGIKYLQGDGVPADGKKAVELFVSAVLEGNSGAEDCLAVAFDKGIGVSRDEAKAFDWLKASALDDYAPAQATLGHAFWEGLNGSSDYAKAFEWNARAAAQGYPPAQADLGTLYQSGAGVKTDLVEAAKWFQLAVDAGFKNAIPSRDEVLASLSPSQKVEARRRVQAFKPETNYVVLADDSKAVTCPLGNYFQIPVKIFGETKYLVPDTGSSCAALDIGFQDRLGEPLAQLPGNTVNSSAANFAYHDCPEIFIGKQRFAPLLAVVQDFKTLRQAAGEPIHGVVGMSCLRYRVVCFDSDHGTFSIGGSVPDSVKKRALALSLQAKDSFDYGVEVFINGHGPIFLAMDSGDTGSIDLNESDWRKVFAEKSPDFRRGKSADIEGKIVEDRFGRLQSLTLGTNTYKNLIATSLANPEMPSRFGQEFIRRHLCYVDFPNRMLYLLPGRHFDQPEEYGMSGLHLLNIGGKIIVHSAEDDSPGFQAGIRPGDQILSVNGHKASSLHLDAIRETLKSKPGDEIKMQIKHGAQTNSVKFLLKRLL